MHRESYPTVDVVFADKSRHQHEVGVMDPNHVFVAIVDCFDLISICVIELFVTTPHLTVFFLVKLDIQTLEIMEQRPENLLMELEILCHLFSSMEDWDTVELVKDFADFILLRLFNKKTWPADPFSFHHRVTLLQVE